MVSPLSKSCKNVSMRRRKRPGNAALMSAFQHSCARSISRAYRAGTSPPSKASSETRVLDEPSAWHVRELY